MRQFDFEPDKHERRLEYIAEQDYHYEVNETAEELSYLDGEKANVEVPNMDILKRISELVPHFQLDGCIHDYGCILSRKNTFFKILNYPNHG